VNLLSLSFALSQSFPLISLHIIFISEATKLQISNYSGKKIKSELVFVAHFSSSKYIFFVTKILAFLVSCFFLGVRVRI
jgi:hypothetical protein